jgi:hypothetical protein
VGSAGVGLNPCRISLARASQNSGPIFLISQFCKLRCIEPQVYESRCGIKRSRLEDHLGLRFAHPLPEAVAGLGKWEVGTNITQRSKILGL